MYNYLEYYEENAIDNIADAFEYVYKDLKKDLDEFIKCFIKSGIAKEYYKLNTKYILGMSGCELVKSIYDKCDVKYNDVVTKYTYQVSEAYYVGIVVATYCYKREMPFDIFFDNIKIERIMKMYYPLHEADISKSLDVIDDIIAKNHKETNLSIYRKKLNITQKELALASKISHRSISLYEERKKDINKATYITVERLARILQVEPARLREYA